MRGVGGAIMVGDRDWGDIIDGEACGRDIGARVLTGNVDAMLVRACVDWGCTSAMWWPEWWRAMKWPGWWMDIEIH